MSATTRVALPRWAREKGLRAVLTTIGDIRVVGGAVRDMLLKRNVGDVDLATPLKPEDVMQKLSAAGIKVIPTGLAHGTVTAVAGGRALEITTLRHDVETDGRHATVAFDAGWEEDAKRRDFTINALYLDGAGQLFDYVGGRADLKAGRVRFVGDPATRIREDVLRLLRFYRFFAHYGCTKPDADARSACRELAPLLPTLSAERVATELLKLFAAEDPLPALTLMRADGVLKVLLPEVKSFAVLKRLIALEPAPDALRRLAALAGRGAVTAAARLKLSNAQRDRLGALTVPERLVLKGDAKAQRRDLYRLGSELYRDRVLLASRDKHMVSRLLAAAKKWKPKKFPLSGKDLIAQGVAPGPDLGRKLGDLETWWIARDFKPSRAQCLAELKRRLRHD